MSQIPSMPETIDILRLSPEATLPTRAHADEAEWAEIAAEVDREEAFGYPAPRVARDGNREAAEADARPLMAEWEKEDREREIAASLSWNSTFGSSRRPDAPASPSAAQFPAGAKCRSSSAAPRSGTRRRADDAFGHGTKSLPDSEPSA